MGSIVSAWADLRTCVYDDYIDYRLLPLTESFPKPRAALMVSDSYSLHSSYISSVQMGKCLLGLCGLAYLTAQSSPY